MFEHTNAAIARVVQRLDSGEQFGFDDRELHKAISDIFVRDRVPLSDSDAGNAIREWASKDPVQCAIGLQGWLGIDHSYRSTGHNVTIPVSRFSSWMRGVLMRHGLPDIAIGPELSLEDLRRRSEETINGQIGLFEKNVGEVEKLKGDLTTDRLEFSKYVGGIKDSMNDLSRDFKDRMDKQEAYYKNALAVRSAVQYWEERAKDHGWLSAGWGVASSTTLAIGIALLVLYWSASSIHAVVGTPSLAGVTGGAASTGTAIVRDWLGSVTRLGLAVACIVWPLRIFVRNYMSHSHLAQDASERALIVQTYLALLSDETLKGEPEARAAMLNPMIQSIFRHASDGIVKDDLMPWQPAMETLKQIPRS